MNKKLLKRAFIDSLPVMAGYIVLGIGFGVLLQKQGYGVFWALLMSVLIFAGSMQYVTIDLIATSAGLISAGLMALFVNIRHLFYGIGMLKKYKNTGIFKPYLIFALSDETFSIAVEKEPEKGEEKDFPQYYFFLSLMDQIYWVTGSVIGSLAGSLLGFNSNGIEFSMTALFVVTFVEQWEKTKNHFPAILGIIVTSACRIAFGESKFLIPSMVFITIGLLIVRKKYKEEE